MQASVSTGKCQKCIRNTSLAFPYASKKQTPPRQYRPVGCVKSDRKLSYQRANYGSTGRCRVVPQAVSTSLATGTVVKVSDADIRWGSFISQKEELGDAMDEAVKRVLGSIGSDAQPDVALVFASSLYGSDLEKVVPMLRKRVPSLRTIFGCSGYGVLGGRSKGPVEVEGEPGFSLTLGQLPGANVRVLHTLRSTIPGEDASPEDWASFVGVSHDSPKPTSFLIFADPRFAQVRDLVAGLDYAFPDAPKIGSILSSGTRSKSRAMWAWSESGLPGQPGSEVVAGSKAGGRAGSPSPGGASRRSRPGTGLRGQRGRGSAGGALFNKEDAVAALTNAIADTQQGRPEPNSTDDDKAPPPEIMIMDQAGSRSTRSSATSAQEGGVEKQGSPDRDGSPEASATSPTVSAADAEGSEPNLSATDKLKSRPGLLGKIGKIIDFIKSDADSEDPAAGNATSATSSDSSSKPGGSKDASTSGKLNISERFKEVLAAAAGTAAAAAGGDSMRALRGGSAASAYYPVAPSSGMYMYGSVVLAIQGEVQLDVITSMGYRCPSERIWRISGVTDSNHIVTLIPEEMAIERGANNGSSRPGPVSRGRSSLREPDLDGDSDDEGMMGGDDDDSDEVQAVAAIVDALDALTSNDQDAAAVMERWEELMETAVLAVASDNSKPAAELTPADWEVLPLDEIVDQYGVLVVGESPVVGGGVDLRRGNRIKIMIRDDRGVREDLRNSLVSYKRRDLGAMLEGRSLPPTFGSLLLTDVDRGVDCYEEASFESKMTHEYVPAPVSGVFGAAQIGPLQGVGSGTAILEYSAVVGVFRAATDRSTAALRNQAEARQAAAEAAAKEIQQENKSADASSNSSTKEE